MIVECSDCRRKFDDEFRYTYCPHVTFLANDGQKNFVHHPESYLEDAREEVVQLRKENARLLELINRPGVDDFLNEVKLEAAHQKERWGPKHDEIKTDEDWFWVLAYLATKALTKPEKKKHHLITSAALLMNWHQSLK